MGDGEWVGGGGGRVVLEEEFKSCCGRKVSERAVKDAATVVTKPPSFVFPT